ELPKYLEQFMNIKRDAADLVSGLSDAQFNWKPAPKRWSIGECFGHLILTGRSLGKGADDVIAQTSAKGLRSERPGKHGIVGNFFVNSMNPPYRMKVKTSADLVPPRTQALTETVSECQ